MIGYLEACANAYAHDVSYSKLLNMTTENGLLNDKLYSIEEYEQYKHIFNKTLSSHDEKLIYLIELNKLLINKDEFLVLKNYACYRQELINSAFRKEGNYFLFNKKITTGEYSKEFVNTVYSKVTSSNSFDSSSKLECELYNIYNNKVGEHESYALHIDVLFSFEENIFNMLVDRQNLLKEKFFDKGGHWHNIMFDLDTNIRHKIGTEVPTLLDHLGVLDYSNINNLFYKIFDFINNVTMFDVYVK